MTWSISTSDVGTAADDTVVAESADQPSQGDSVGSSNAVQSSPPSAVSMAEAEATIQNPNEPLPRISGKVVDSSDTPIAGATVFVRRIEGQRAVERHELVSDANGEFALADMGIYGTGRHNRPKRRLRTPKQRSELQSSSGPTNLCRS